ncbi:hypothetical protein PR202_gb18370 [Eleusine coracana subsp. coracana]|uniref:Riboflavin biosynthesis protein PYRD, chloroplastic n=1 Tax=Eleusine coracana subsp. coracana TaxID=191504 RepID=A0AAV5F773_ELECO|nr:hypothetical protein PR202_gb18370 [Eleusine coracana subsp. coracana]
MASWLVAHPQLAPRPVRATSLASPPLARLAAGRAGGRGLTAGVRCQTQAGDMDRHYMRRCVELARKATGHTSPNPMVGCVIVRDGRVVGEGFHPKAGQPHAEVFALRDAGDLAENSTAYVSLEPCNHYGRTPPCTEALINAKVKEVVVGMTDPNPIVASKGIEKLRGAGIDVRVGVEEALCRELNEAYIHRMHTGKPFATLREAGEGFISFLSDFQEKKLVQKVVVEMMPVWLASEGFTNLGFGGQSFPLKNVERREVNGCLLLEGYV